MIGPGNDEPVHPVVALPEATAASARAVIDRVSEIVSQDLEWSEDDSEMFGQMSTQTKERTANVDVHFSGSGPCTEVRIMVGSCGARPYEGHWTSTLDVCGMSPSVATLDRVGMMRAVVALSSRMLDAALSEQALHPDDVSKDPQWEAARRHAQGMAAEIGASFGEAGCQPLSEVRVRHPYGEAPAIVHSSSGRRELEPKTTCDVRLPRLGSIAFVGSGRDGTVYVGGAMRTASIRAAMADPVTTLRLLKELAEERLRNPI